MSRTLFALLLLVCALAAEPAVTDNPPLVSVEGLPLALRAADLDGDAKLDFLVVTREWACPATVGVGLGVGACRGLGNGTFHPPVTTVVATGSTTFDVALLDGDSVPDLVALRPLDSGTRLQMYRGLGDGSFAASGPELLAPSCAGGTFSLAEMTGDGRIDITCALTVFPNLGGGTFGSPMTRTFTDGIDRSYVLDANRVVDAREPRRSAALLRGGW